MCFALDTQCDYIDDGTVYINYKMCFALDTQCDYSDDRTAYINYKRIDEYWRSVLESTNSRGSPKYPSLGVLVKALLSLLHGQADAERGFSISKQVLEDKTLISEHCLRGTRTLKDVITSNKSLVNVPISRNLINAYRKSHSTYKITLDKPKQQKKGVALLLGSCGYIEGKQQLPVVEVSQMKEKKKKLEDRPQLAENMISDGTEHLGTALNNNKIEDALSAQALLESVNKMLKDRRHELELLHKSGLN